MRISDWSSDVCSSDLLRKAKLNDLANIDDGPAFIDGPILVENALVFENRNRLLDEFLSRKKIVLLIDETLFVIGKLGHIIPFEKWGEPKRSEEHTSELQSLMRISYAVFCLKKHTK